MAIERAVGPNGLLAVLNSLLAEKKQHHILYQPDQTNVKGPFVQQVFIEMDTAKTPPRFFFKEVDGRPVPQIVKDTIAKFLWENCELQKQYKLSFNEWRATRPEEGGRDCYERIKSLVVQASINGEEIHLNRTLEQAQKDIHEYREYVDKLEESKVQSVAPPQKATIGWHRFFQGKDKVQQQPGQEEQMREKVSQDASGPSKSSKV